MIVGVLAIDFHKLVSLMVIVSVEMSTDFDLGTVKKKKRLSIKNTNIYLNLTWANL